MNAEQIQQQQALGFRSLNFTPRLEPVYRESRSAMIRQRARPVSIAGLALYLVYAIVDILTLPPELASITAGVRLAVVCPIIILVLILAYQDKPSDQTFEKLYTAAYLVGGVGVIAIILAARKQDYPLPYEGMILMLMFGYFAMGLPFKTAAAASSLLVIAYLSTEAFAGTPTPAVLSNGFFLLTANAIGMIGSWVSEYRHRAHFLDRQLLDLMHQATEAESRRKTELITAASHDLRQPLNAIYITLENLKPGEQDGHQSSVIAQVKDMVAQLRRLLGTVLDSARLSEGMIQPEIVPVSLEAMVQELHDLMNETLGQRNITLTIEPQPAGYPVLADPGLLLRILQNLVINAADHSGGNTITVSSQCQDHRVRLQVADNGKGVAPELGEQLFQPYVRGTSPAPCPGLGLGLTIVREFTGLMNGRCGVDSRPKQGSVFWVELPATTTSQAPGPC
ncbi:MAG: HAMP domain-containing histidine kinase [Alteromonadaceae bacterium]|uniref:sensor histidine kinase n=1 Tax=Marinobacter shengliensis TaxID=1389223 RepID=UPI0011095E58|nr:HAMP domain-containing sensor histidine kinase [Marinobacter shengliensis]MDX5440927.1 HAMP domain-containing histidine kinase [Alteromonadaceae bacterium]